MSIEYIGNKRNIVDFIYRNISLTTTDAPKEILDLFCGTGSVGLKFKENNYRIKSNDFLYFCTVIAKANMYNDREPDFKSIISDLPISIRNNNKTAYDKILDYLNSLDGLKGFIYKNYSPASKSLCGIERMYFSGKNAEKIDAIRIKINEWNDFLNVGEKALLLKNLLISANKVSNTAGTYGCYMKYWKRNALIDIKLEKSKIIKGLDLANHEVYNEDANYIAYKISSPIIYADPPYTKRQYSAYYHLLETIAIYDNPVLIGKTGLRPWKEKNSDYCYKKKAPKALENLVKNVKCKYLFLSYNNEGQIKHDDILNILSKRGIVDFREMFYKRYKSNNYNTVKEPLKERLYILKVKENY